MIVLTATNQIPWSINLLAFFACLALAGLPVSILLIKLGYQKTHKYLQSFLSYLLIPVFAAFELHVRTTGWRDIAEESQYYDAVVIPLLPLHMLFAFSCLLCWFFCFFDMLKKEQDQAYRSTHKKLGYASSLLMYLTAATGLCLYYYAFIAV